MRSMVVVVRSIRQGPIRWLNGTPWLTWNTGVTYAELHCGSFESPGMSRKRSLWHFCADLPEIRCLLMGIKTP